MENYKQGDVRKVGEGIHLLANSRNHQTDQSKQFSNWDNISKKGDILHDILICRLPYSATIINYVSDLILV